MILLNKPNKLSFSNNIKNFEFFSHTSILFTLECDGKEIIKERHSPGDGGTIDNVSINLTINISDIINEMLSLSVPSATTPLTLQDKAVKTFTAKWKSAFVYEEYLFRVVKGGINSDVDVENFFKNNFLTKQPQVKEITVDSIEFLNYYTVYGFPKRFTGIDQQTEYFLKIEANTALGFKTKTINTQEGLNCLNVSYTKIKDYFKTDKIYDYKVFIVDRLDERLSTIQSYILVNKKLNEKQYFFENNLGGWDTIRITGECSEESSTDFEKYKINGISGATNTQYLRNFKQHGLIDIKYQEWIDELLSSNQIFSIENYLRQIIINDIDISSEDDLCEYSFNYELCDQNIVSEELKRNSDIPILDYNREDLFFLNKRLSNLPSFNLSNLAIGLALPAENVKGNTGKLEVTTLINHTASLILGQISSLFDGFVDKKGIKVSLEPYALKINYYDKEASDNRFANKEFYYNKEISDKRFALKVNYYDKQTSDSRFPLLTGDNNFTGEQRFVGDIHVTGSIFQHGALKKVVAEHVEVKNEFVHLRQGASTAIGPNMISGFSIENYNGSSKSLLLGGGADGIARVGHEGGDLQAIATRDEAANLVSGNGVVWNASKKMLEDAGYRWARKNGDLGEDFDVHHLKAKNAQLGGISFLYATIGTTSSQIHVNYQNADGSTDEYRNFYIFNGKHSAIANFFGETKKVDFYGDIQVKGSIHSSKYVSGVTGKGWNISPDANAEFTNLSIRDSLVVNTFVNNKINIRNGDLIISDSSKIIKLGVGIDAVLVQENVFQVGDIARCSKNVGETYYLTISDIRHTTTGLNNMDAWWCYYTKTGTGLIEIGDLLVRWNSAVSTRKGLLYFSGLNETLDVIHDQNTKVRLGNLSGISDPIFGKLLGYGLYANNVYLKGKMQLAPGSSISFADVQGGQTAIDGVSTEMSNRISRIAGKRYKIDASSLDEDKYYILWFAISKDPKKIKLYTNLSSSGTPKWATHSGGFSCEYTWTSNGSGWGGKPIERNIQRVIYEFTQGVSPCGSIGQDYRGSYEFIYVRGGGIYYLQVEGYGESNELKYKLEPNRCVFRSGTEYETIYEVLTGIVTPVVDVKSVKSLATEANNKIDGLKTTDRNLIKESDLLKWNTCQKIGLNEYTFEYNKVQQQFPSKDVFPNITYKDNTQYVISFDWKAQVERTGGMLLYVYYTDGTRLNILGNDKTIFQHFEYVTKENKTVASIRISYGTAAGGSTINIKNFYLKEGNKATGWSLAPEDVDTKIKDVDLGERNLLLDSGRYIKNRDYQMATYYYSEAPKNGEIVKIVMKAKLGAGKSQFLFYNSGGGTELRRITSLSSNMETYETDAFSWTVGGTSNTYMNVYAYPSGSTAESEIEWIKLVKGNKTSLDWSEAPEDQKKYTDDEIEGIEVGGTNLFTKEQSIVRLDGKPTITKEPDINGFKVVSSSGTQSVRISHIIPSNGEYTLSFWVKRINPHGNFYIDFADVTAITINPTSEYVYYKVTKKVSNWSSTVYNFIDIQGIEPGGLIFKDFKFEKGNKSTDWSAATEDAAIYSKVGGQTLITNNKIRTSLLEATEIRSQIINTTYLNGLSLNFTKGIIGGWSIGTNKIQGGNTGIYASGSIINGSSSSPKWYLKHDGSGSLANQNIKWDQSGNTSFKGKVTALSGLIGGWHIDSGRLSSSNMFLDAVNGWLYGGGEPNYRGFFLSNNGSGYLAKKNISWDAAGNLTFKGNIAGSVISGSTIKGATILGAKITTNAKFASQRVEIDNITNSLSLYDYSGARTIYISDSGLANFDKGVGLIDMKYFDHHLPGPAKSNVKHSSVGSFYNGCIGFSVRTKQGLDLKTNILINPKQEATNLITTGIFFEKNTSNSDGARYLFDIYSENTCRFNSIQVKDINGLIIKEGIFDSTTDGNQRVTFSSPFKHICYGVIVKIGPYSHYTKKTDLKGFDIDRYNDIDKRRRATYIAFGC